MEKVLKNEDLMKKTDWQRKTYPLKLKLTDIQQVRLENLIYEYKKATNLIIQTILKDYFKNHLTQLTKDDWEEGTCESCKTKKKLKFILKDFEFVKYREIKKGKPNYKPVYKKDNEIKICEMCSCSHYSLRKFLYSTSNREVPIEKWNFTKKVRLDRKLWDSCVQKAVENIKSQVEIKKKIEWKINLIRNRILNNQIEINKKRGENYEKYGEKVLRRFIKSDEKKIEKEKKKVAEDIEYKNDAMRIYENNYQLIKEVDDYYIRLRDFLKNNWLTLEFYGEKYQKKLADKFLKSKNAETEIIRKKDDFYLQYIYRKSIEVPISDETFTAIGIDVNIINLAALVSMNKDMNKILDVKFYSGRNMRNKRKRFKEVRKIWQTKMKYKSSGGKGRSRKWYNKKQTTQNEKDYVKYKIHHLTTNIIQYIKDRYDKPVIVLENLKGIRDRIGKELKIQKSSIEKLDKKQQKAIRGDKLLNSELNNWNFDDFQKFLEYKANWMGIPVVYVNAKDTSICCNKCGHCEEENYENLHRVKFKCKKCDYECNADFNASVNIARRFYDGLKETPELRLTSISNIHRR